MSARKITDKNLGIAAAMRTAKALRFPRFDHLSDVEMIAYEHAAQNARRGRDDARDTKAAYRHKPGRLGPAFLWMRIEAESGACDRWSFLLDGWMSLHRRKAARIPRSLVGHLGPQVRLALPSQRLVLSASNRSTLQMARRDVPERLLSSFSPFCEHEIAR